MDYLRLFLNILICIILFYVFFKFIRTRAVNFFSLQENLISMVDNEELNNLKANKNSPSIGNIQSIQPKIANMPLKEYCIKASYNSAVSGKSVNKNMIKYVLNRGCRFLDFEVFYIKSNDNFVPVVAESSDPEYKKFDTDNHITLESAFSTLISNAFSGNSPNKKDPLFVHLRIKTKDTNCYSSIAKSIDSILKAKLFEGEITKDTKLAEIMGKIVIVVDKTIHRDYKDYAKCKGSDTKCYDLSNYLNIESGSQNINLYNLMQLEQQASSPALIKDDNVSTSSLASKVVLPVSKSDKNPDMKKMILDYGAQIVAYRYSNIDDNLVDCEVFFNDSRGGVLPLAAAIPYFERVQKELTRKK